MADRLYALAGRRVFVAGHRGMAGSAIVRRLSRERCEILTVPKSDLDLRDQPRTHAWFARYRPDAVVMAAGKVGGIVANEALRATFLYDNLMMAANVVHAAFAAGVSKLMFLGSTCIYPRLAPQPLREDALLTGPLEPTNAPYAIAKIAGVKLVEAYRDQYGADFISVMPTNLYGPGDNYRLGSSHVVAALLRRFHEAKVVGAAEVTVWGTGTPRREFLFVDDLADACVHLMERYSAREIVNIGAGRDIAIADLAALIAEVVGYVGRIVFDPTRPDGAPRKLVDASRLAALGWRPSTGLADGLRLAYRDFLAGGGGGKRKL
jgi:GDP-L-fucose synthase